MNQFISKGGVNVLCQLAKDIKAEIQLLTTQFNSD